MSTGFVTLASAGSIARSLRRDAAVSAGNVSPDASHASAHRIPSPPAFVSTATRGPAGSGCRDSSPARSISSSSVRTLITPAWWNRASTAVSEPARAAVCDPAALAPAVVAPALRAITGLWRETRRARRANLRGLPNDSMYSITTLVSGSSSHHSSRSLEDTSALFPTETNPDSPRPWRRACSSTASPSAPLCDEKPIVPCGNAPGAKVAFSPKAGTATPRQFGPSIRAPRDRTSSSRRRSRRLPGAAALGESGRDHADAPRPSVECLAHLPDDRRRGDADDGQVDRIADIGDPAVREVARHRSARPVHGMERPGEARVQHVAEELTADRSAPRRGADDGHRSRCQQGLHRSAHGLVVAGVDALAQLGSRGDREPHPDRSRGAAHLGLESGMRENVQHRGVGCQHLSPEGADPSVVRGGGQAFEQARADAVALQRVGDCERRLGLGASGDPDVVADRDDPRPPSPPLNTDVGAGVRPVGIQVSCQERRVDVCHPVEAQVPTAVGELVEEPAQAPPRRSSRGGRRRSVRPSRRITSRGGASKRVGLTVVRSGALSRRWLTKTSSRTASSLPSAISLITGAGSHGSEGNPLRRFRSFPRPGSHASPMPASHRLADSGCSNALSTETKGSGHVGRILGRADVPPKAEAVARPVDGDGARDREHGRLRRVRAAVRAGERRPDLAARLGDSPAPARSCWRSCSPTSVAPTRRPAARTPTRAAPSATSPGSGRRGATGSPPGPATPPSRSSSSATRPCSGPASAPTTCSRSPSASALIWVLTLVNIAGVRESGIIQLVTTVLKFVPLLLIGLIGLFYMHSGNFSPFDPHHVSLVGPLARDLVRGHADAVGLHRPRVGDRAGRGGQGSRADAAARDDLRHASRPPRCTSSRPSRSWA